MAEFNGIYPPNGGAPPGPPVVHGAGAPPGPSQYSMDALVPQHQPAPAPVGGPPVYPPLSEPQPYHHQQQPQPIAPSPPAPGPYLDHAPIVPASHSPPFPAPQLQGADPSHQPSQPPPASGEGGQGQPAEEHTTQVPTEVRAAVENEHWRARHSVFVNGTEISQIYGRGVWVYFFFSKFVCILTALIALVQAAGYIPNAANQPLFRDQDRFYNGFFVSSYGEGDFLYMWRVCNYLSLTLFALASPSYYLVVRFYYKSILREVDQEAEQHMESDKIRRYTKEGDIDTSTNYIGSLERLRRYTTSYSLFFILVGAQFGISFGLTQWGANKHTLVAILCASSIVLFNFAFKMVAWHLTEAEKPKYWTQFYRRLTFKVMLFKFANVGACYLGKKYEPGKCADTTLAEQTLIILAMDLFFMKLVELVMPCIMHTFTRHRSEKDHGDRRTDEDMRSEFNPATEYLQHFYRLFLMGIAMPVFPLAPAFVSLISIVEYWVDKYKLIRLCKKPPRTRSSSKKIVVSYIFFTFLVSLLAPWPGAVWVLSGRTGELGGEGSCPWRGK